MKCSIPIPTKKYADSKKLKTIQELQQFFPELIALLTDGTEQQIPSSFKRLNVKRKSHVFRQKRKNYTVQNLDSRLNLDWNDTSTSKSATFFTFYCNVIWHILIQV